MYIAFWNVEQSLASDYRPSKMKMRHNANIFQLELNENANRVLSGGADEQLIVHDTSNGDLITSCFLDSAIYALSMNPFNSSVCSVGCEGRICLLYIFHIFVFNYKSISFRWSNCFVRS